MFAAFNYYPMHEFLLPLNRPHWYGYYLIRAEVLVLLNPSFGAAHFTAHLDIGRGACNVST